MKLNLKRPLAVFDLETTGTNIAEDRIVEISIVKVLPNHEQVKYYKKVNPTIPISKEASRLHGIYEKDIQDAPTFKMIAKEVAKFLEGADLAGFNVLRFDLPLLAEEFLRAEVDFKIEHRSIVDAQKIFHLMEKRTLSAAYKFYCNKTLVGAHSAEADTLATLDVLMAQIDRYQGRDVEDATGKKITVIENDVKQLNAMNLTNMIDFAGRLVKNEEGTPVFNFGKHKGKPVTEVLQREPSYYDWMMKGSFALDTKRKLTQIKLKSS